VTTDALLPGLTDPGLKAFRAGTHRMVAPEETLARVRRFMPVMGITRLANVTGLDVIGVPVVSVCRPNSRSLAVSQGKGLTLAAAKASGVMESVEYYHAENITLPLVLASYERLRYSETIVDVTGLTFCAGSLFHPTDACSGSRGTTCSSASPRGCRTSWCTPTSPSPCPRARAASSRAPTGWPPATTSSRPRAMRSASWWSATP
jgi:ribosomal protein S12 methylthiotransferase accessory factor